MDKTVQNVGNTPIVGENSENQEQKPQKLSEQNLRLKIEKEVREKLEKEAQAKDISKIINDVMEENWHMKRMFANPLSNADKDIYRFTMRYSCKIDEDRLLIYS